MTDYKIQAKVKFNDSVAVVLDKEPVLKYYRLNPYTIYGTDGVFYACYQYEHPTERWKAFAGRKFDLQLEDGEVIHCTGQWWDAGYATVENALGIKLCGATVGTVERLIKCYVFSGYMADADKYKSLLDRYGDSPIFPYWDYEKVIKYDSMRKSYRKKINRLEHANKSLIQEVKAKHKLLMTKQERSKNETPSL